MTRCSNRATQKQQLTHVARLKAIQEHTVREVERYVCEDCADVLDKDWITVLVVNPGDAVSVLKWGSPQCEGIVEETDGV